MSHYYRDESLPEIEFRELCDGTNFRDQTFRAFVHDWMSRNMPGMPLDLLDTEDCEAWEIIRAPRFEVEEREYVLFECPECGSEHVDRRACCTDDEDKPIELIEQEHTGYVILDTEYDELYEGHRGGRPDRTEPIPLWNDEDEAHEVALDASREAEEEGSYGFPWAHSWFFMPDRFVDTETLHAAGFVVAEYKGYRLCGIDGGGYSFEGRHYALLVGLMSQHKGVRVSTDKGDAYVTFDYRHPIEKLVEQVNTAWEDQE